MNKHDVDEVLLSSRPRYAPSIATEAALDALVVESRQAAARRRKSRRLLWLVPGAVLAVGALTGGALVVDQLSRIDVPVPISYVTDTGIEVSCSAQIESSYFSPDHARVTEYYATHDFTADGLGQRIYDYALVLAGDKPGSPAVLPNTTLWYPGMVGESGWEPQDGRSAVNSAIISFVVQDVIDELDLYSGSGASQIQTDCTGQLH